MALKGHEYIRQTLERYTHCGRKNEKLHREIRSRHTEIQLDIAMDAVRNPSAKGNEAQRKLTSEWQMTREQEGDEYGKAAKGGGRFPLPPAGSGSLDPDFYSERGFPG